MQSDVPNVPPRGSLQTAPGVDNSYYAYHDPNSAARFSTTVVHALADLAGTDVTEMEETLGAFVDPEALDRLFSRIDHGTPQPTAHVAFTLHGYRVTVYSDGQIVLTPPQPGRR